jgi:hypothetical protein
VRITPTSLHFQTKQRTNDYCLKLIKRWSEIDLRQETLRGNEAWWGTIVGCPEWSAIPFIQVLGLGFVFSMVF